jgi:hypothetical protein
LVAIFGHHAPFFRNMVHGKQLHPNIASSIFQQKTALRIIPLRRMIWPLSLMLRGLFSLHFILLYACDKPSGMSAFAAAG